MNYISLYCLFSYLIIAIILLLLKIGMVRAMVDGLSVDELKAREEKRTPKRIALSWIHVIWSSFIWLPHAIYLIGIELWPLIKDAAQGEVTKK